MPVRVGHHPNNLHLTLASLWPEAFGVPAAFVPYAEGRDTPRLLADGKIDIGGTGSTPAVLAQARGLPVRYIAASAPRPANGAVLVPAGSPAASIAALKGRRVGLVDGSFLTYLLARLLEAEGFSLRDVERIEIAPDASRAALDDGRIDAWIAMAPHLEPAERDPDLRVLARVGGTIPNRSVFWTLDTSGLTAADDREIAAGLARLGSAVTAEPDHAGRLLAGSPAGASLDAAGWTRIVRGRDWTVLPADAALLAEQRAEAETLKRHGDLPPPTQQAQR